MFTLAALAGCACNERVEVHNQTPRTVFVQMALPYPSYAFAATETCQYQFLLKPGEQWKTTEAEKSERAQLPFRPLRRPNGPLLVRVRGWTEHDWKVFALNADEPLNEIDPLTIAIVSEDDWNPQAVAHAAGLEAPMVEHEDSFWFMTDGDDQ